MTICNRLVVISLPYYSNIRIVYEVKTRCRSKENMEPNCYVYRVIGFMQKRLHCTIYNVGGSRDGRKRQRVQIKLMI